MGVSALLILPECGWSMVKKQIQSAQIGLLPEDVSFPEDLSAAAATDKIIKAHCPNCGPERNA
jgi:hypothetical protein